MYTCSSQRNHKPKRTNNNYSILAGYYEKLFKSNMNVVMLLLLSLLSIVTFISKSTLAFQGFSILPKWNLDSNDFFKKKSNDKLRTIEIQDELIDAIRKQQQQQQGNENNLDDDRIRTLIQTLEQSEETIGNPAIAPEIYGRWRLLYSTNTDTSSPIQRTAFRQTNTIPIYQDIIIDESTKQLKVNQVIQFNDNFYLSVDALASTSEYPLAELTNRQTTGKIFGMNLLGVSLVNDDEIAQYIGGNIKPNSRIDFVFDEGNFYFNDQYKIPYPVPFRFPLLRDWVKGWIIITYLSPTLRIVRGNKGTTFVLIKE